MSITDVIWSFVPLIILIAIAGYLAIFGRVEKNAKIDSNNLEFVKIFLLIAPINFYSIHFRMERALLAPSGKLV